MVSLSDEAEVTSFFADRFSNDGEGELRIDEGAFAKNFSVDPRALSDFDVAVRQGEECLRQALIQTFPEESAGDRQG